MSLYRFGKIELRRSKRQNKTLSPLPNPPPTVHVREYMILAEVRFQHDQSITCGSYQERDLGYITWLLGDDQTGNVKDFRRRAADYIEELKRSADVEEGILRLLCLGLPEHEFWDRLPHGATKMELLPRLPS